MFVIFFLIFSSISIDLNVFRPAILHTSAFNIDEEYPIVIVNKFHGKTAHFGASVALLPAEKQQNDKPDITGWVIIGAPKANSTEANKTDLVEPGVIWRCSLGPNKHGDICQTVEMDPTGNDVIIDPNLPRHDRKDGGWLGGSMYVGESDYFVTCGSRWINQRYNSQYLLNGMCYWLPKTHLTAIHTNSSWPWLSPNRSYRLSPLLNRYKQMYNSTFSNKTVMDWAYGQFGFSLHLTPNNEMIVGSVGVLDWAGTVAQYKDTPQPRNQFRRYNAVEDAPEFSEVVVARAQNHTHTTSSEYFGYSVTSGKFFKPEVSQNRTQFASGAPRSSQLSGKVVVFSMKELEQGTSNGVVDIIVEPIEGSETTKGNHYGSYFGSSVLALDVSGDGFDDLLVGAPLYGTFLRTKRNAFFPTATAKNLSESGENVEEDVESEKRTKMRNGDEGCVFIYFSTGEDFNRSAKEICGDKISGARFGVALTSLKDINSDGFNDVAVGAPYESDGRGAVYIYHGGKEYLSLAQKLQPEYIDIKIRTFGWSISLGVDVDANGYPDLAVGAYESNHVVIYRTIPIVNFTATLTASIPKLLLTTQEFNLTTCISYTGKGIQSFLGIMVKLTVETEPDAKRLVSFVPGELTFETPLSFNMGNKVEQIGPSLLAMRALILSRKQLLYFVNKGSCYNFTVVRIGSVDDGLTRSVPIRLDYWLDGYDNVDGEPKPIYYEIQKDASTNSPVVNLTLSKSDFKDFSEKKLPMTGDNMFGTEKLIMPVATICEADGNPECLANLTLNAWLVDLSKQDIFNEQHPFLLGSADVLTLEVDLANYREIATLPIVIGLSWTHLPIVRRRPSNCEQIVGNTSVSTGNAYQCKLARPIIEFQKEILNVELDMSGLYGEPEDKILDIYLKANSSSFPFPKPEHCLSVTLKTQMKPQNFSHEPSKIEYAGNSSVPTFGIPQAFEIGLDGPSSAAALLIEFDIPHKIQVHGKFLELFGVKEPNVAYDGKMACLVLPTSINDTSQPGNGEQQSESQMTPQKVTEPVANPDPDASTNSDGKMKQKTNSFFGNFLWRTTDEERPFEVDYESDGEVIKLNCASKHISCLRVSCVANHFTPTKKAVVEFKLRMFNNVAGILLNQSHHDDHIGTLWIESVGKVRTLDSNGNPFGEVGHLYLKSRLVIPPPYELPAWILIVSVAGGFLLFTIVTMILLKCGFFRRSKRDQLERMKLNKAMETHYGKMTNLNLSASSSSTARVSASSSRSSTIKNKRKKIDQFDIQSGGSILGVTCNSPGTLVKQRQGTVDLTELRRLYASLDQNELY